MSVRILVIDEKSEFFFQLKNCFLKEITEDKIFIDFTESSIDALNRLNNQDEYGIYDVVFCETLLHGSSGYALLSTIKEAFLHIKVIMISSEDNRENIREAMRRGAFDFFVKNVDDNTLRETIEKAQLKVYLSTQAAATKKENTRIKKQLAEIIYISQMISSILDINFLLEEILNRMIFITEAERGAILLYDEADAELKCYLAQDKGKNSITPFYSTDFINLAVQKRDALSTEISDYEKNQINSAFCVPLEFEENIIGVLYLDGDRELIEFTSELMDLLKIFSSQASISIVNARKNSIIRKQLSDSMQILYSVIATNSSRVYEYSVEAGNYCRLLCNALKLSAYETERILFAVTIHDLSIVGILENVFYSAKPLNEDERKLIERHPLRTVEIIEHLEGIKDIKEMILQHHERYNGTGYPLGLKGDNIVLGAQIIGLVDDFSLLLRMRQYQNNDRVEKIIQALQESSGKLYAPLILKKFIEVIKKNKLIYIVNEKDILEKQSTNYFEWQFPSSVNFEPLIVSRVMKKIAHLGIDDDFNFFLDFSICEVIRNAIVHGNKYNQQKSVTISLELVSIDKNKEKIIIKVQDEGVWTEFNEHNRFTHSREAIFEIFSGLESCMKTQGLQAIPELNQYVNKLRRFIENNYVDYHTFLKIDGKELSGGIGLFQVKKIFDHVEFESIVDKGVIIGTQVTLTKIVEKNVNKN